MSGSLLKKQGGNETRRRTDELLRHPRETIRVPGSKEMRRGREREKERMSKRMRKRE